MVGHCGVTFGMDIDGSRTVSIVKATRGEVMMYVDVIHSSKLLDLFMRLAICTCSRNGKMLPSYFSKSRKRQKEQLLLLMSSCFRNRAGERTNEESLHNTHDTKNHVFSHHFISTMTTPSESILDFCLPLCEDDCFRSSSIQIKIYQGQEREADEKLSEEAEAAAADAAELMHDTGFVMWPSAVMLSRYITQHPHIIWDCDGDILELGAGCGLVGLTAAALLKQGRSGEDESEEAETSVIMTDYNPAARVNLHHNAILNQVDDRTSIAGLDFFDQMPTEHDGSDGKQDEHPLSSSWVDMDGNSQPQVHLILGADIIAYSNDAEMVANTIQAALIEGGQAILMGPDANQRFGMEQFEDCCLDVGLNVAQTVIEAGQTAFASGANHHNGDTDEVEKHGLAFELEQSGVVTGSGYGFVMFTIEKPIMVM
jgi:predicted nicotinamide N-methyase